MKNSILFTAIVMVAFLGACAKNYSTYSMKLTGKDRDEISAIMISIVHDSIATEKAYYISIGSTARGTMRRPMGASSNWDPIAHDVTVKQVLRHLNSALRSSRPGDEYVDRTFSSVSSGGGLKSNIEINGQRTSTEVDVTNARFNIHIEYKVGLDVGSFSLYRPFAWVVYSFEGFNADGTLIYDFRHRIGKFIITNEFTGKEFSNYIESTMQIAAQQFWSDIQ